MGTPAGILADFASVLFLLRDHPELKEEARQSFKRFAAHLSAGDHAVRVLPASLMWDQVEVPLGQSDLVGLHDQLRGHGIGEIRFPIGLMTSTLVSLVRTLAAPPGTYGSFDHLIARLDAAGCGAVRVHPLPDTARTTLPASPSSGPSGAAGDIGVGPGLIRNIWEEPATLGMAEPPAQGAERVAPPAKPVEDDGRLADLGPDALTEAKVGMMHFVTTEVRALNPLDDLVRRLGQATGERNVTDLLNQILAAGEAAVRREDWPEVVRTASALIRLERQQGPQPEGGRTVGIALRRLLPRSVLEEIARLTTSGNHKAEATAVLRRMGADGTEVLLMALCNSEEVGERRGYFTALKEMNEGSELLVHMLSHDQWYVVRNVADLCGEIRLERSVPALSRQVGHDDERVRRSVAGALARIGGSGAVEPLRRALRDPAPTVRLQAARDLDAQKNRGLAMSLAVAAEEESKGDVQREMYLALGRIGSPEAIQALKKAAEPGGRFFGRKPLPTRLAAVEALGLAGPSAAGALKDLLEDEDRQFRAKVEQALRTLWQ